MRRAAAALAALLAAVPLAGQVARHPSALAFPQARWRAPDSAARRLALASGAVLFVEPETTLPLVEIVVVVRAGAFLDPPGKAGASYLTAQLLARGGTRARPAGELDAAIERLGGRLTTSWTPSFAALGLSVPSWALAEALDLYFELLRDPGFEAARREALVANLEEGMARRNDDAVAILEREWEWLLYGPDHFSTRPLAPADLERLTRDDLVAFHRRWWRPLGFTVAVAGDVDRDAIAAELERRLADWPAGGGEAPPWPPPAPGPGRPPGLFRAPGGDAQVKVMAGHRLAPVPAADRPALALLGEVLGGSGAVSRLQGRLRTAEGLVYRSDVELEAGELWPGELRLFFETRPEQAARALELALDELRRIREQEVPAAELAAARESLLGLLRLGFDSPEETAGHLAENALFGRPDDHWERHRAALAAVTAADVRRVARTWLRPDELTVLVVGPLPDGPDPLARLLGRAAEVLPRRDPSTLEPRPGDRVP